MARLIDAEALEKLLVDMATDAKSIRELQLNALCYAAVRSESMTPTIDAIPVEWLKKHVADNPRSLWASNCRCVLAGWQHEQEEKQWQSFKK